jgi:hypothetical protein
LPGGLNIGVCGIDVQTEAQQWRVILRWKNAKSYRRCGPKAHPMQRLASGPQPKLTIKIAELNSNDFQTLVPDVDSRDFLSFGKVLQ